jgi:hypothetical protein
MQPIYYKSVYGYIYKLDWYLLHFKPFYWRLICAFLFISNFEDFPIKK